MNRSCEPELRAERGSREAGNLPPADELFAVRAKLKELTEREQTLRELMLKDADARTGNHYAVELKTVNTSRTDYKEIKAQYPDIFTEFTYPFTQTHVVLRGVNDDGELVSLRRKETSDEGG